MDYAAIAYATVVAAGGVMGYVKKGSLVSGMMGLAFGGLLGMFGVGLVLLMLFEVFFTQNLRTFGPLKISNYAQMKQFLPLAELLSNVKLPRLPLLCNVKFTLFLFKGRFI